MSTSRVRLVFLLLWLASLAGAYYIGKSTVGGKAGSTGASSNSGAPIAASRSGHGGSGSGAGNSSGLDETEPGAGTAGDGGPIDVRAMIAKVKSQIGMGAGMMYNPTAMMKAMAPMAELSESQVREALEEVEATIANKQQKMMFYSLLLGRLAETDGAGAMAYVEENLSGQGGFGSGITMSVMGTWSRREPDAAWEWFKVNRDSDSSNAVVGYGQVAAVFAGMASKDLNSAFDRLEELEDFERTQAISGIAMSGAWDPEFRTRVLDRAESLPDETRKAIHQGMIGQWAMTDPDSAIEWMDSLTPEERQPLARQAGPMLMMSDPERGADMMLASASEDHLNLTYSSIISQWSRRDPNAAGEWLNRQPEGADLDQARAAFARNVVKRDPYSAMEWAKTVGEENQRRGSIQQVYTQWKAKDLQSADAALDQSGLTPDQIEAIRNTTVETRTTVAPGFFIAP